MTHMHDSVRVRVDAMSATSPGYEIVVSHGVFEDIASRIAAAAPAACYAVVTPQTLADSYGGRACNALRHAGLRAELLVFDDSESNKSRGAWATLTDRMLELRLGRDSCVVAVGGGVTGDLAGFVAATYMRGIPFVQVPTTLLAMIDASVGGKTGVDTPAGKNLIGAFHAPAVVLIDPAALHTLPAVQLRSGLAEAVKHGAALDAEYFAWMNEHADAVNALDAAALEQLITRSVELKAEVVSGDPLERGRRAVLNFGHTVGHALEKYAGYTMPHGFAVSAGMCIEAALGEAAGVTEAGTAQTLAALLARFNIPTAANFEAAPLLETMIIDKKARAARPRFALLKRIGECAADAHGDWTHEVDTALLHSVLHDGPLTSDLV